MSFTRSVASPNEKDLLMFLKVGISAMGNINGMAEDPRASLASFHGRLCLRGAIDLFMTCVLLNVRHVAPFTP